MARLEKVTLNLYAGDMKRLRDLYPVVGASVIIRELVRQNIASKELAERKAAGVEEDVDL